MSDDKERKILRLLPKEERRLQRGHLWAYRNEFACDPSFDDGEVVDIYSSDGDFVARGFYQAQGGIAVRVLDWLESEITPSFIAARIEKARAFRTMLFPGENVYRWMFGESDGLPGLVVDRYGSVAVAHSSCGFYHSRIDAVVDALMATEGVKGVRTEMRGEIRCFGETPDEVDCSIDGVATRVNLAGGQKTGLFLDQRMNWRTIRRYAEGKRVLDGHCYTGFWAINAALAGAASVKAVDTSTAAIECAQRNAEMNGVADRCSFERVDVMNAMQSGEMYDVIVLDPPALAKTRIQEKKALGLYQALNASALKALSPGGILITSSCSHFVTMESFQEVLKWAAMSTQRHVWILESRGAALDHPVLIAMPETSYLKCVSLRAL
jgi:23S rRNA (cytosine1962-C5)-methyltransferase